MQYKLPLKKTRRVPGRRLSHPVGSSTIAPGLGLARVKMFEVEEHKGGSKNSGTPKWMV